MVDTTSSLTFRADSSQFVTATNNLNANAVAAGRAEQAAQRAGRAYGGLGHIAGQAGFQIQDATVQLQMGTNAMVVLAQQGSQFAGVFGPTGAVVGAVLAIGAALVGTFLPSLFKSTDAVKELDKALQDISKTVEEMEGGGFEIGEAVEKLLRRSEGAFAAALRSAAEKGQKDIKAAISELEDITNDFVDVLGPSAEFDELIRAQPLSTRFVSDGFGNYRKVVSEELRVTGALINDGTFKIKEEAREFAEAFKDFSESSKDADAFGELRLSIDELFASAQDPSDSFREFRDTIANVDDRVQMLSGSVRAAKEALSDFQSGKGEPVDPFEDFEVDERSFVDLAQERADAILEIERKLFQDQKELAEKTQKFWERAADQAAKARIRSEQTVFRGITQIGSQISQIIGENAEEGSRAAKVAYGISQGIQVAQAINSANVAYANILATIPPVPGGFAAFPGIVANAEIARGLGYASAALIAGNAAGTIAGRAQGGQVRAGEAYRVGEFGPETLIMGNQSGTITNKPMGGAPVEVVNNITVEGGSGNAEVETSTRQVSDTKFVQDIVIREMGNQNSASRRALSSTSNVKGVGTR